MRWLCFIFSCAFFSVTCRASLHVALPLEGFFHAGRYMPVAVSSDDASPVMYTVTISGDGAATTVMDVRLSQRAQIVPLLVTSSWLSHIVVTTAAAERAEITTPLHPLERNERLVAGSGDVSLASELFPSNKIVSVQLEPREEAIAFQTLDAVVLDKPWVEHLPAVLAGGTAVIVRGANRPDAVLPWRKLSTGWALAPAIAGPVGCDVGEDAYLPTYAWHPDLPSDVREQVVLFGVLFALVAGATVLLPVRFRLVALVGVAIVMSAGIAVWQRSRSAVFEASGTVIRRSESWEQGDLWRYFKSPTPARVQCDATGMTWPIFADSSQMLRSHATLHVTDSHWEWTLAPSSTAAFLTRTIRPSSSSNPKVESSTTPGTSPLTALARPVYGAAGSTPSDAMPSANDWPSIQLRQ